MQGSSWTDRHSGILGAWWQRLHTSVPLTIALTLLRCFGSGVLHTRLLTFLWAACPRLPHEVLRTSAVSLSPAFLASSLQGLLCATAMSTGVGSPQTSSTAHQSLSQS